MNSNIPQTTLCVICDRKQNRLLLAMKKRGFGAGKWNGTGGKPHPGESIEETAIRETEEEIGIKISKLKKVGELTFHYPGDDIFPSVLVHLFLVTSWSGEPIETEEMRPAWFSCDNIPFPEMWADDPYWLPRVLKGEHILGQFYYNESKQHILNYKIKPFGKINSSNIHF